MQVLIARRGFGANVAAGSVTCLPQTRAIDLAKAFISEPFKPTL
jgi:hypothetical protein